MLTTFSLTKNDHRWVVLTTFYRAKMSASSACGFGASARFAAASATFSAAEAASRSSFARSSPKVFENRKLRFEGKAFGSPARRRAIFP